MSKSYYQFAATKAKAAKSGYASLTTSEKWEWHADIYGWRQVRLGISADERTSPPDQNGDWYNPDMVRTAVLHYRGDAGQSARNQSEDDAREGRDIANKWAQQRGPYLDLQHYADVQGISYGEAAMTVARGIIAGGGTVGHPSEPPERTQAEVLAELGVTATERVYTAEEMRAGRIALGLEEPDPPAPPERVAGNDDDPPDHAGGDEAGDPGPEDDRPRFGDREDDPPDHFGGFNVMAAEQRPHDVDRP